MLTLNRGRLNRFKRQHERSCRDDKPLGAVDNKKAISNLTFVPRQRPPFYLASQPQLELKEGMPAQVTFESIVLPQKQVRRYFDPEKLAQLTLSIEEYGLIEPLIVRPLPHERYELIAGERRYRAIGQLRQKYEIDTIPAIVRSVDDWGAAELALVENLQREDLNPIEETYGILELLCLHLGGADLSESIATLKFLYARQQKIRRDVRSSPKTPSQTGDDGFSATTFRLVEKLFQSLGTISWESFVTTRLPLLELPAHLIDAICEGKLEYSKVLLIARVKDECAQQQLLAEAIASHLSQAQIRQRIKELQAPSPSPIQKRLKRLSLRASRKRALEKLEGHPDKLQQLESLVARIEALLDEVARE